MMHNPETQMQEVLYELLSNKKITVRQMMADTGILNLSARISNLRLIYHIDIETTEIETKNKFDRKIFYGEWTIDDDEKEYAESVYEFLQGRLKEMPIKIGRQPEPSFRPGEQTDIKFN